MSIVEKIKKIVAKAESTTSPEEAQAFMEKAQQLMMEHGFTLLDLGKLDDEDPVGVDKGARRMTNGAWEQAVLSMLGPYYGCRVIIEGGKMLGVAGRESARVTFLLMAPFVVAQVRAAARRAYKAGEFTSAGRARTAIGNALALRIRDLVRAEREKTTGTGLRGMNALVPVDSVQAAMEEAYGKLGKGRARSLRTSAAGKRAAQGISLRKQTGRAPATRQISG